jgi:hypothetical protein
MKSRSLSGRERKRLAAEVTRHQRQIAALDARANHLLSELAEVAEEKSRCYKAIAGLWCRTNQKNDV